MVCNMCSVKIAVVTVIGKDNVEVNLCVDCFANWLVSGFVNEMKKKENQRIFELESEEHLHSSIARTGYRHGYKQGYDDAIKVLSGWLMPEEVKE